MTETQTLEIYHKIIEDMDQGKDIRFLLLDVSAAFNKVWHKVLLAKLQIYRITGRLHNWIRTKRVLEGSHSKYVSISASAPQRSILGPLFFLLYVNDLPENT